MEISRNKENIEKIKISLSILEEMVFDRKYKECIFKKVIDEEYPIEFNTIYIGKDDNKIGIVIFNPTKSFKIKPNDSLTQLISLMIEKEVYNSIILHEIPLSASVKKNLSQYQSKLISKDKELKSLNIECWRLSETQFNLKKHEFQPKIVKRITDKKEELKAYNKKYKLPEIFESDPLMRWHGFREGDYVCFTYGDKKVKEIRKVKKSNLKKKIDS